MQKLSYSFITSFLLVIGFIGGCHQPQKFFVEDPEYLLYYGSKEISVDEINFTADLKAHKSTNQLYLYLTATNNSERVAELDFFQGTLFTKTGLRSNPIQTRDGSFELAPGEHYTDTLVFNPINNDLLYKFAGINGDLGQQYAFSPREILGLPYLKNQIIFFKAEPNPYEIYLSEYGQNDQISIWELDVNNDQFISDIESALKSAAEQFRSEQADDPNFIAYEPSYQLSGNELLMGGLVCTIKSYQIDKTLNVDLRIVNHQSLPLQINTASFKLLANDKFIVPTTLTEKALNPMRTKGEHSFELLKGERMGYALSFDLKDSLNDISFVSNIQIKGSDLVILDQLPLVPANQPSQALVQMD